MKNRFAEALALQDAGNMRGIARTFVEIVDAAFEETQSTKLTWRDPAVVAVIAKLADLAGIVFTDNSDYAMLEAFRECEKRKG